MCARSRMMDLKIPLGHGGSPRPYTRRVRAGDTGDTSSEEKQHSVGLLTMKNDLFAMFILIAAFVPGAALADLSEPPTATQDIGAAEIDSDQTVLRQLLQLAREARVSVSEAIGAAEKLHDGSRTTQIGFDKPDSPEYRVRTVRGNVIWENNIDARNGRIIGKEKTFSFGELSSDDRRDIDALKHVRPELLEAVAFAEKTTEGTAVGATLIDEDGTPNFAVVVISGDRLKQVMLEARRDDRHASAFHRPVGTNRPKN
jgi:uncharacterized membrane protein YkoI